MSQQTIAVAATFTAEPIKDSLSFFLEKLGVPAQVEFAPYNQVFQELLDHSSLTSRNRDGINVVLVRLEDWAASDVKDVDDDVSSVGLGESIERSVNDFARAIRSAALRSATPYIVVCCPPSGAVRRRLELSTFFASMEDLIAAELADAKGVTYVSWQTLQSTYPIPEYDDPQSDSLGHIPYTQLFFVALGTMVGRRIYRLSTVPHKVIALDCDQTLWRGVCGEDGPLGIEIDDSRRALQEFMVRQHKSGMLLCLCSKNNEQDVFEVFDRRPEMPLKRDHILSSRINWSPKSENLRSLSTELNLGLDSFILIDDDPIVCAEVRANCPEVLTLQLPQDSDEIDVHLKHIWALDPLGMTSEDESRTNLYKVNVERERLRSNSETLEDFLAGLGLEIIVSSLRPENIARVSQLTQRTNQFNLTTIRRSESEIEQLRKDERAECLVVSVVDRFGDYGLVGAIIFRTQKNALEVDTFLLSCRALGRGVEQRMLAELGRIARDRRLEYVDLRYRPTEKNRPAFEFLSNLDQTEMNAVGAETIFRVASQVAEAGGLELTTGVTAHPSAWVPKTEVRNVSAQGSNSLTISSFLARIPTELNTPQQIAAALVADMSKARTLEDSFVAPRNDVEAQLKTIWEEGLCVQPIGTTDNYFDLGGDSFQAVRIFVEIEKCFGRHLPLVTILESPTIRQLADLLQEGEKKSSWSSLVPIQSHGSRTPFYCIHAAGGSVLFYRDLAKHLGVEQPFYGLQARGLHPNQSPHDSVEEMAACYVDEIRAFQPEGPYYLGGSSFGGLVAFEMARQLNDLGQVVGLLALFDTYGPGYLESLRETSSFSRIVHAFFNRLRIERESLRLFQPRDKSRYLLAKARKLKKKLVRKVTWKKNEFAINLSLATGRPLPKDIQRNHKSIQQAEHNYQAKPYRGQVTLFRANAQPSRLQTDGTLGWKAWTSGGVVIHDIPGFHGAVTINPYARFLAEELLPCLTQAQLLHEKTPSTSDPASLSDNKEFCEVEPINSGTLARDFHHKGRLDQASADQLSATT